MMKKSLVILRREWLELKRQRGLLLGIALMPALITLIPVIITYVVQYVPDSLQQPLPFEKVNPALFGMTHVERQQTFIGQTFAVMLLLIPLIVPSIIASYSIIGEKLARTLEPVLATPVTTGELLFGKCLAAGIPAVIITWICGAIFVTGLSLVTVSRRVLSAVVSPGWFIVLLLCVPLIVMIAVTAMVAISSRVNDPRTAQQISAVAVIPVLTIFFAQLAGLLVLSPLFALGAAVVLAVLALASLSLAIRIFQREAILTRWT
jgi:ABC-2 type transport system permease protein